MRLLHTSDWHLGRNLYEFSLLEDQKILLDDLLHLLESKKVDVLLIAGDIYDRPIPPAAAIALYDAFLASAVQELGVQVLAIAGNHDSASRLAFGSRLYAGSGYHVCGQVQTDIHRVSLEDRHGPVDIWLLPYLHPAKLRALFPQQEIRTFDQAWRTWLEHNLPRLDPDRRNIAVAHGFFSPIGARDDRALLTSDSEVNIGGMDIADSTIFSAFDYTALGHLHAAQRVGSKTIRYAGSPLKYSLSEETQNKSYTLLDLGEKGDISVETLPIALPRDVRSVHGSLEQLLEPSFHPNQQFDDYVFAYLTDREVLYPMEKLRKLFPNLLGLRLQGADDDATPQIRLGERGPRLSPEEMFLRFFRDIRGEEMPAEARQFLQQTLESIREQEVEE